MKAQNLVLKFMFLFVSFVLVGCPSDSANNGGPVAVCKSAGTQCKMSGGQLGVCSYEKQNLVCLSQH